MFKSSRIVPPWYWQLNCLQWRSKSKYCDLFVFSLHLECYGKPSSLISKLCWHLTFSINKMVWRLNDLCLHCVQKNLASYPNLGSSLPNIYKERLIERLACHDLIYPENLSHIAANLFASSLRHINLKWWVARSFSQLKTHFSNMFTKIQFCYNLYYSFMDYYYQYIVPHLWILCFYSDGT